MPEVYFAFFIAFAIGGACRQIYRKPQRAFSLLSEQCICRSINVYGIETGRLQSQMLHKERKAVRASASIKLKRVEQKAAHISPKAHFPHFRQRIESIFARSIDKYRFIHKTHKPQFKRRQGKTFAKSVFLFIESPYYLPICTAVGICMGIYS